MVLDKHIRWVLEQLPVLVQDQVIDSATAGRIDARYRPMLTKRSQQNSVSLALAIVGAVLIGGGILLLFAHNWLYLSRPLRTFMSFVPLVAAQILTLYVFLKKSCSRPWQEAAAILHGLMTGSALFLISQTYHQTSFAASLALTWIILIIPLVYFFRSVSLHILIHAGIVFWFFQAHGSISRNLIAVILALPLIPFVSVVPLYRKHVFPCAGHTLIRWSAALTLLCVIPNMLVRDIGSTILICFALLLSSFSLAENTKTSRTRPLHQKPFLIIGSTGVFIVLLLSTVPALLKEFAITRESVHNIIIVVVLLAINILAILSGYKRANLAQHIMGLTGPVVLAVSLIASVYYSKTLYYWFFFLWLAGLGIAFLRAGFRERRLIQVNLGMGILLLHIFVQFMRADIGLFSRSAVFIGLGVLFLVVNHRISSGWKHSG